MSRTVDARIGYLVKQLQQQVRQAMDAALRDLGLSTSQYAVLLALVEEPGLPAAELARRCFVTRQSLQDVLSGLRAAGLVRVATTGTGRSRDVSLTADARELIGSAEAAVRTVERRMLRGVPAADARVAVDVLRHCSANLASG